MLGAILIQSEHDPCLRIELLQVFTSDIILKQLLGSSQNSISSRKYVPMAIKDQEAGLYFLHLTKYGVCEYLLGPPYCKNNLQHWNPYN